MPTYRYKCNNCDFELEEVFKISDRNIPVEQPEKYGNCSDKSDTCEIRLVPSAPGIQYTIQGDGRNLTSDAFKDRMKEIHRTSPGSQLGDYT